MRAPQGLLLSTRAQLWLGFFLCGEAAATKGRCKTIAKNDGPRVNGEITARTCRLIGVDGSQLGLFGVRDAMRIASE